MTIAIITLGSLVDMTQVDDAVDPIMGVSTGGVNDLLLSDANGKLALHNTGTSGSILSPAGTWNDNELAKFHGASGGAAVVQGANVLVDDSFNMTAVNDITLDGDLSTKGFRAVVVAKTTTYTATTSDHTIICDASGGAFTVTLPAVSGLTGFILNIKKKDSSANAVTIDGNTSETIDGATTAVITAQFESITVQCDGTEWWII